MLFHASSVEARKTSRTTTPRRQCENQTMNDIRKPRTLILGSSSRYRRELLERLRLPFEVFAPDLDESPLPDETPLQLASRLALAKAHAIARQFPHAIVIGSDQVADLNGLAIGKPGSHQRAVEQLTAMSGQAVIFHTVVAVVCAETNFSAVDIAPVRVKFRHLSAAEIENYLLAETPYDCAGSAKSEGLGITLLSAIESDDPTALIGLPLIRTSQLLRQAGLEPLLELNKGVAA